MTTIVTTCKGRFAHLKQSLTTWCLYTTFDVLIVDYGCPEFIASLDNPRLSVIYLPGRRDFNKPVALNVATYFLSRARSESRFLFFDADTVLEGALPDDITEPGTMWIAKPTPGQRDLTGVLAVDSDAFEAVGGYDDLMSDYGAEDIDLRTRLHLRCDTAIRYFPDGLLRAIPHTDFERTRFHTEKDIAVSGRKNVTRLFQKLSPAELARLEADRELCEILLGAACRDGHL